MPHSNGYRARTRSMFRRDFGTHGVNPLSIYMRTYKVRKPYFLIGWLEVWGATGWWAGEGWARLALGALCGLISRL